MIAELPATETVLLGRFSQGPAEVPLWVDEAGFLSKFGSTNPAAWPAEIQARQFFRNGGVALHVIRINDAGSLHDDLVGDSEALTGLNVVETLSNTRLLIVPELAHLNAQEFSSAFAVFYEFVNTRRIFMILDPPPDLETAAAMVQWAGSALPPDAQNCAVYYPYLQINLDGLTRSVAPSGAMAAIYEKSAAGGRLWESPAGTANALDAETTVPILGAADSDLLSAQQINPIRVFSGAGVVPWAARTLDRQDLENRQLALVRTRLWIASSIERSLTFAATNNNATPLWIKMRTATENFLQLLFQQGAFAGSTPAQAYFVRCDATTTTAADIAAHRVNLLYGVAELRPAEFVVTSLAFATHDSNRRVSPTKLHLRRADGELQIAYPTEPAFAYNLETLSDLKVGEWSSSGAIQGDGAWRRVVAQTSEPATYFRLRIMPLPGGEN